MGRIVRPDVRLERFLEGEYYFSSLLKSVRGGGASREPPDLQENVLSGALQGPPGSPPGKSFKDVSLHLKAAGTPVFSPQTSQLTCWPCVGLLLRSIHKRADYSARAHASRPAGWPGRGSLRTNVGLQSGGSSPLHSALGVQDSTGTGREEGPRMLWSVCKCQGSGGQGRRLEWPQRLTRGDNKN